MPDIFIPAHKHKIEKKAENKLKEENPPFNFFGHFAENPKGIRFENQKHNEEITLFLRQHLITNVPWLIGFFILIILLPIIIFILPLTGLSLSFIPERYAIVLILLYYLTTFAFALIKFMHWFYNITIISTKNVVDMDYADILYHDVAFTNLNLVEDVNYTKTGFFRSFFNFGDVFIQTAGGKENLEALAIAHPAKAAHLIADSIGRSGQSG